MNLSEGDVVVTPGGRIEKEWLKGGGYTGRDVVAVDQPLRIRVDHETDARALMERAEEAGFCLEWPRKQTKKLALSTCPGMRFSTNKEIRIDAIGSDYHLTYPSDSDQIIGWLDFHDSEECETCGGEGVVSIFEHVDGLHDGIHQRPCPDCSDDDEQTWESPDPSDPAWREAFLEREKPDGDIASARETGLALGIDSYSEAVADIFDYISTLEAERDELKQEIHQLRLDYQGLEPEYELLKAERDELRERIREAKDYVTHTVGPGVNTLVQILDGEGDGSGE